MGNKALEEVERLININNRLLEICIYALISNTKLYNHELDTLTKLEFMDIILNNLNDDTHALRDKLLLKWEEPRNYRWIER